MRAVILADWGNSSGRLFCVQGKGFIPQMVDSARVVGAKDTDDCAAVFEPIAKAWIEKFNVSEAVFCGAVTSNIGWQTTPYAQAPASLSDVQISQFTTEYGLSCKFLSGTSVKSGPHGYFDTVRGEDMQAFGWTAMTGLESGIICTPGTHTKWLTVEDGAITDIFTGVTGETFEVLNTHSMLTRGHQTPSHRTAEFDRGLDVMQRSPRPALTQMLMSVRNLQLCGEITAARSADYLSGLLTGEDCRSASDILSDGTVHIIGDRHAAARYQTALERFGREVRTHDGQACVIAGLQAIRALL